jgi:hypothetical protein
MHARLLLSQLIFSLLKKPTTCPFTEFEYPGIVTGTVGWGSWATRR